MTTFQKRVISVFHALKHNKPSDVAPVIPVYQKGLVIAQLRVISQASLKRSSEIQKLAVWRRRNNRWFPSQFRVTLAGTKRWSKGQLLDKEDRILFMIEDLEGRPLGHVGFYRFTFDAKSCEVDNVIRGEKGIPGLMTAAIEALCQWGKEAVGIGTYTLRVVAHNAKAVSLYKRCGFVEIERIPLKKVVAKGVVVWEELPSGEQGTKGYFDLKMKKKKS